MSRKFVGFNQSIVGGSHTAEELDAARAVGAVNGYRESLFGVLDHLQGEAPGGWRVTHGEACHTYDPPAPTIAAAANEPILIGFVRVHDGDPHFPIWLYRQV